MTSGQGEKGRSAGRQRLALILFAGALVLLFIGFAIAQGIGPPGPSAGEVAIVEDVPDDIGVITEDDLELHVERLKQATEEAPESKPEELRRDTLRENALKTMISNIWIQGETEELGISVTEKELAGALKAFKKGFPGTFYEEFLQEQHATQAEIEAELKVQILTKQIPEHTFEAVNPPSSEEIEDYYRAAVEDGQFAKPETRNVRRIFNEDEGKIDQALKALEEDNSVESWERVAKKFSTGSDSTKEKGGLLVRVGQEAAPTQVFKAPVAQIEGPVKSQHGFAVFEVTRVNLESQSLEEVESQIVTTLSERIKSQATKQFLNSYATKWKARTFCASDLMIELCDGFEGDSPPLCEKGNPEFGLSEGCRAPVQQLEPALPGSVSAVRPNGIQLAQRPVPPPLEIPTSIDGSTR